MRVRLTTLIIVLFLGFLAMIALASMFSHRQYTSKTNETPMKIEELPMSVEIKQHQGSNGYIVYEIQNILNKTECVELIALAKDKGLSDSSIWSFKERTGNSYDNTHRRSKQAWLPHHTSPTTHKVAEIAAAITGIPISHQEQIQIAMYEPNGMFNAHFDACDDDDKEYCNKMNNGSGERRATLLIYLNDEFEGGETTFVNIGVQIKPKQGNAIMFYNTDDNDVVIQESKHQGNQVISGEKWICTVWSHSKEYKERT